MSFRGGRTARGTSGRGRGGRPFRDFSGVPASIIEAGHMLHTCESLLLLKSTLQQKVPYFNGRVFLENKQEVGKVDEILGPINNFYFSVKLNENIKAESFETDTKFFIDSQQVLPLSKFLSGPPTLTRAKTQSTSPKFRGSSNGRGGSSFRGGGRSAGRFVSRGAARGSFNPRGTIKRGTSSFRGRGS